MLIRIKKGLDIPLGGAPEQAIHPGPQLRHVAIILIADLEVKRVSVGYRTDGSRREEKNNSRRLVGMSLGIASGVADFDLRLFD